MQSARPVQQPRHKEFSLEFFEKAWHILPKSRELGNALTTGSFDTVETIVNREIDHARRRLQKLSSRPATQANLGNDENQLRQLMSLKDDLQREADQ